MDGRARKVTRPPISSSPDRFPPASLLLRKRQRATVRPVMHRCLQIPEILANIFSHLLHHDASVWPRYGSKDLAHVARTCRTLSGPALDALWYSQTSLLPLLKCMRGFGRSSEPGAFVRPPPFHNDTDIRTELQILHRAISPSDYQRLHVYSSRIKEIIFPHQEEQVSIHPVVFSTLLSQEALYGSLLPKLHRLSIDLEHFTGQGVYARLTVGDSLRSIHIGTSNWRIDVTSWEDRMASFTGWKNVAAILEPYTSNLENFTLGPNLSRHKRRYGSLAPMAELYHSFYNLHTLDTHNFDSTHTLLSDISAMPRLKKLSFAILSHELSRFTATVQSGREFNNVVDFEIHVDDLSACTKLMARRGYECLESLSVVQSKSGGDWSLEPFFKDLYIHRGSSPLKAFRMLQFDDIRNPHSPLRLTSLTLGFLFHFDSLSHLQIDFDLSLEICDTDMKEISKAWPRLRILHLSDNTTDTIPLVTFNGLLHLAESCQHLEKVKLRVNALELPTFATIGSIVAPSIRSLDFCTSPLLEYDELATMIPLVFPGLTSLSLPHCYRSSRGTRHLSPENIEYGEAWRRVPPLIALLP
ncbi:hypothetical protein FPV67DRAFT_167905 [Lyophyllum atratum]|nr:hypothetical protein FPV67DRAFT_167905 [Lyophyllum atratum]